MSEIVRCPACSREAESLNIRSGREYQDGPPQPAKLWALPCGCNLTEGQALTLRAAIIAAAGEDTPK